MNRMAAPMVSALRMQVPELELPTEARRGVKQKPSQALPRLYENRSELKRRKAIAEGSTASSSTTASNAALSTSDSTGDLSHNTSGSIPSQALNSTADKVRLPETVPIVNPAGPPETSNGRGPYLKSKSKIDSKS